MKSGNKNNDNTLSEIAEAIFDAWRKNPKDTYAIDWIAGAALFIAKLAAVTNVNDEILDKMLSSLKKDFETSRRILEQTQKEIT